MPGSSPPTRRVVDVIELLAERHGTPTRLSDIVQTLGINKATAYAILTELCETGWVVRDPIDKTFFVGPALVRVAGRIDESGSLAHALRRAAAAAAQAVGYAVSVSERVGDALVITVFLAGGGGDGRWRPDVGDRLPYAAPFGPAYAAWDPAAEQRTWIERGGVGTGAFAARLDEQLARTRDQGFSVERLSPEIAAAIPVMTGLHTDALTPSVRDHLDEILVELAGAADLSAAGDRDGRYVGAIAAPIFDVRGRVSHNLCAHPFTTLTAARVERIGRELTRIAAVDLRSGIPADPP